MDIRKVKEKVETVGGGGIKEERNGTSRKLAQKSITGRTVLSDVMKPAALIILEGSTDDNCSSVLISHAIMCSFLLS